MQIAYLQQNLRPQVVSITPLPYGVALQKTPSLQIGTLILSTYLERSRPRSTLPGSAARSGSRSPRGRCCSREPSPFTWKASDDNDDDLVYSIYFRGDGESDWKLLEKRLTDTFYTLDGAALPDGIYTLKVVASDAESNPYGKFLIGELISKPFVISNSTPLVEVSGNKVQGERVEAQFRSRVATGRIATGEFSVDGGEWFLVFPTDGIADSAQEDFQFQTAELAAGEHIIGVRSSDANGNTGTAKIVVRIP